MSNNLERRILVVGGTPEIIQLISAFGAEVIEIAIRADHRLDVTGSDLDRCDAILLNEISSESLPPKSPARSDLKKILEMFHQDARPIAAIGQSLLLIAEMLPDRNLEIAFEKEIPEIIRVSLETTDALLTACAADDYISDRLNKSLTTLGSLASGPSALKPGAAKSGVGRLLRELVEMA